MVGKYNGKELYRMFHKWTVSKTNVITWTNGDFMNKVLFATRALRVRKIVGIE